VLSVEVWILLLAWVKMVPRAIAEGLTLGKSDGGVVSRYLLK
jgi:hypothetical protein